MWCLYWLGLQLAAAVPLDRVEVVVDTQLVLSSDIALDLVLQELDQPRGPFWSRPPTDPKQRLADAALLRQRAGDLAIYQPSPDDVQARLDQLVLEHFATRGAWEAFLTSHAIGADDVRVMLRRRMVVERYLARNLRVSAQDGEDWWRACEALLADERTRARIRTVPPRDHP